MPLAIDRNEKMWTARNLNDLYARFDNKCARTLDGKTPYVVGLGQKIPFGVTYEYSRDPDTSFYVSGSTLTQTQIAIELSKLESKHLDVAGGQVYVDHYVNSYDPTYCNVGAIQTSFELHNADIGIIGTVRFLHTCACTECPETICPSFSGSHGKRFLEKFSFSYNGTYLPMSGGQKAISFFGYLVFTIHLYFLLLF